MIDKNELCSKIQSVYPDIGECGIDVDVEFDDEKIACFLPIYFKLVGYSVGYWIFQKEERAQNFI